MAKSRIYTIDLDPTDTDADGIAEAQQLVGAGNLTLDGTSGGGPFDYERMVTLYSTGNLSGVTFTVTGTTRNGATISEDITGPNNGTVVSTKYYYTVTSIAADGAVGTDMTAGISQFTSRCFPLSYSNDDPYTITVLVTGTINYTAEECFEDILSEGDASPTYFAISDLTSKTASLTTDGSTHATAVRVKSNSFTNGAELKVIITQSRR